MLSIRKLNYQTYAKTVEDRSRVTAEIFVDEVSELPETEGIDGYTLCMGSIAYIIRTGELYVLGSDRQWYGSSQAAARTISETKEVGEDEPVGTDESL